MSKPFSGNYGISGNFGATGGAYGNMRHAGVDFALPANTPVLAANGGRVVGVGRQSMAGIYIKIAVANRTELYMHLNKTNVIVGQIVSSGQQIGLSGRTGNATGNHLHYEVRINNIAVNPTPYYSTSPPAPTQPIQSVGGRYKALRTSNVRPAPNTSNTPFASRQLRPGDVFDAARVVEGQTVTQNGITSNLWVISTRGGAVWSGNLQKIA